MIPMQISCTGREKIQQIKNAKIWPLEIGQCEQGYKVSAVSPSL